MAGTPSVWATTTDPRWLWPGAVRRLGHACRPFLYQPNAGAIDALLNSAVPTHLRKKSVASPNPHAPATIWARKRSSAGASLTRPRSARARRPPGIGRSPAGSPGAGVERPGGSRRRRGPGRTRTPARARALGAFRPSPRAAAAQRGRCRGAKHKLPGRLTSGGACSRRMVSSCGMAENGNVHRRGSSSCRPSGGPCRPRSPLSSTAARAHLRSASQTAKRPGPQGPLHSPDALFPPSPSPSG